MFFSYRSPTSTVFVTFQDSRTATLVRHRFRKSPFPFSYQWKPPLKSESLSPENWKVTFAPTPENILWNNLTESSLTSKLKNYMANGLLIIGKPQLEKIWSNNVELYGER